MTPTLPAGWDSSSGELLYVVAGLLREVHGHDDPTRVLDAFLDTHGQTYDEDFLHHETPYSYAGIVHYCTSVSPGNPKGAYQYVLDHRYHQPGADGVELYTRLREQWRAMGGAPGI